MYFGEEGAIFFYRSWVSMIHELAPAIAQAVGAKFTHRIYGFYSVIMREMSERLTDITEGFGTLSL